MRLKSLSTLLFLLLYSAAGRKSEVGARMSAEMSTLNIEYRIFIGDERAESSWRWECTRECGECTAVSAPRMSLMVFF